MKNIPVILFFLILWGWGGLNPAHAQFYEGPNEFSTPPYPYVVSQPIDNLPEGFITIGVGRETYYYSDGVFYQKVNRLQKYVVVPPPIGGIVFSIPQGYQLVLIHGVAYYEYGGTFYKQVLNGYKVIYPPPV